MRTDRGRFVAPLVVFAGTFGVRLITPAFLNDHVSFLSRARQILYGDVPVRDFLDPGFFLALYISAAVDWLAGHRLVGEALLASASFAIGYALLVVLARRVSGSTTVAVAVALVAASLLPRLMNHHKVLVPAVGLCLAWRYVRRGTLGLAVGMGAFVGIATLYRHDHGAYLAPGLLVVLAIRHRPEGVRVAARHAAAFAAALLLVLAPFVSFVALNGGISAYLSIAGSYVRDQIPIPSPSRQPALVVDDDAPWLALAARPPGVGLMSALARARILPGIVRAENAGPALYYLVMGLGIAGVVLAIPRVLGTSPQDDAVVILCAAIFCMLSAPFFLRDVTHHRLGDGAVAPAVIGAWLLGRLARSRTAAGDVPAFAPREAAPPFDAAQGRGFDAAPGRPGSWPVVRRAAAAVCVVVVWALVATVAPLGAVVAESGLSGGPASVAYRARATARYLLSTPLDVWAPPDDRTSRALVRYVHECTRPTDRVLSTGFSPQYHYFADRAFAGARIFWPGRWFDVDGAQSRAIASLEQESVPIVVVDPANWSRFASDYPAIARYLLDRYVIARDVQFPDRVVRVLVDRDATARQTYEALHLPCFV